ncbi:MAG: RICIN domain-containing protein, partial [Coriobacteriia bacterium]|nr:RICIN domain-containing protein [Coriobacteriia bacterium]
QAKRDNTEKQRWSVTRSKDGKSFIIKNAWSGKVLNLNGSAAAGTAITALKANAKASQAFVLRKSGIVDTGAYQLSTLLNKKFVLYAPKAKKGTQVAIAKKNSTKLNQRFYVRAEADGKYSIQSVATGMFIADVKGKAVLMPWSNSDKSLLWDCTYAAALQFLNASTGKAMLVSGGKAESKAPVATGAAGSGKAKKWSYLSKPLIATSTYAIKGANGNALEVANGSYAKGANVRTAAKASASGSNCFEVQAEGKYFRLVNTKTYQAVAVKGAYKKAGTNVAQVPVASKKAQLWKATIGRDGTITFVNAKSKMAMQVAGKNGNVNQGKATSSKSQAFTLKPVKRYSLSGNTTLDKNVATILSAYTSLRSCFSYVTNFSYREGARFYSGPHYLSEATTISYANDMVAHHSGNCYRFASLFSWLARGLGYSSKVANGHVPSASGGLAPHGWTWIYTADGTYICDPDLNHEMPGHNWYMTTVGGAPTTYGYW